jgi:TBC1 domain family member 25
VSVIKSSLKPLLKLGKPRAVQLQGLFKSQMERTLGMVQRALKPEEVSEYDPEPPEQAPVDDVVFRSFLDPLGTLEEPGAMRAAVFSTGVEPSLRKVVWKHLLNVYPEGLSGKERIEYMRQRQQQYNSLKDDWIKQAVGFF